MNQEKINMDLNSKWKSQEQMFYVFNSKYDKKPYQPDHIEKFVFETTEQVLEMLNFNEDRSKQLWQGLVLIKIISVTDIQLARNVLVMSSSEILSTQGTALRNKLYISVWEYQALDAWSCEILYRAGSPEFSQQPRAVAAPSAFRQGQTKPTHEDIIWNWSAGDLLEPVKQLQSLPLHTGQEKHGTIPGFDYTYRIDEVKTPLQIYLHNQENQAVGTLEEILDINKGTLTRTYGYVRMYYTIKNKSLKLAHIERDYSLKYMKAPPSTKQPSQKNLQNVQWAALTLSYWPDQQGFLQVSSLGLAFKSQNSKKTQGWQIAPGPKGPLDLETFLSQLKKNKIKLIYLHDPQGYQMVLLMGLLKNLVTLETRMKDSTIKKVSCSYGGFKFEIRNSYSVFTTRKKTCQHEKNIKAQAELAQELHKTLSNYRQYIFQEYQQDIFSKRSLTAIASHIWKKLDLAQCKVPTVPIIPRNSPIGKKISNAYYGGIVEIKKHTCQQAYLFDVNSMYPWQMFTQEFPVGTPVLTTNPKLEEIFGFCLAEVESNQLGILPQNTPNGLECPKHKRFTGWYFSEELKAAEKYGYKLKILESIHFPQRQKIFKNYVQNFYQLKENAQAGTLTSKLAKLFLNALYGSFAINKDGLYTQILVRPKPTDVKKAQQKEKNTVTNIENSTNDYILNLKQEYVTNHSPLSRSNLGQNIALSTAIAAYSRIAMLPYRLAPDTIYTDTDSIITEKVLDIPLNPRKLGYFKQVDKIKRARFYKKRFYAYQTLNDEIVIKSSGLDKDHLTDHQVESIIQGQTNVEEVKYNVYVKDIANLKVQTKQISYKLF